MNVFTFSEPKQPHCANEGVASSAAIRLVLDCEIVVECDTVEEAAAFCKLSVEAAGRSGSRREVARSLFGQLHSEIRRVQTSGPVATNSQQSAVDDVAPMSRRDLEFHNLVEAVPSAPEDFRTTMEIWHLAAHPKPAYTAARDYLRQWAASGCGLIKVGGAHGPQWYRYDDSAW